MRRVLLTVLLCAAACTQRPIVELGYDADTAVDEDGSLDEQAREQLFLELAQKECRENEPVCGSDGRTYRNLCQALGSGVDSYRPGGC